ncbi:MAG: M28 family peptidase [Bacteroidales bacterium]|nr:M28 family peptidase [Bacteroidales bacterium]
MARLIRYNNVPGMNKFFCSSFLLIFFLLINISGVRAQDLNYAKHLVDTLSSPSFEGRGYVNGGDSKAAEFLANEFRTLNIQPFGDSFMQAYDFPINTLPGKLEVSIDGQSLDAGSQFQVWAASPTIKGTFRIIRVNAADLINPAKLRKHLKRSYADKFILIDRQGISDKRILSGIDSLKYTNYLNAKGLIFVNDQKLSWSVMIGYKPFNYPVIDIIKSSLPSRSHSISLNVESKFYRNYKTQNVIGFIKGSVYPDTFLVFTAHYDHLGRMGEEVYFPGANDNASGTAMVMDLARHYSIQSNAPAYSMVFILLSGEEAGLHGSNYCAEHPPFNLKKVKFLMNIDMIGTGSEGITVVNGSKFKEAYQRMVKINADQEYILTVKERGESCNSDHCPFYKKGVPAVFIYSMGKEFSEYHNEDDLFSKLPFTEYSDIFRLVKDFMNSATHW